MPAQSCAATLPPPCALTYWPWFFTDSVPGVVVVADVNTGVEIMNSMLLAVQVDTTSTETLYGASVTLNVAPPSTGTVLKLTRVLSALNEPVTSSAHANEPPLSDTVLVPVNVLSALTVTLKSCFHTLANWWVVSLGWRAVNVAVVTVVLTGADASQRGTSADAAAGMAASMATAMPAMTNFFIRFLLSCSAARHLRRCVTVWEIAGVTRARCDGSR